MTRPPVPLSADQQRELVRLTGVALASTAPQGWRELRVDYRAAGRHVEVEVLVLDATGQKLQLQPHPEATRLLGVLRGAMYTEDRGTWLGAMLIFKPDAPAAGEFFTDVEPAWRNRPPALGFQDELRLHPRDHLPDWLRRAAALPGAAPDDTIRSPRVYDGLDRTGRPLIRRDPLPATERDRVLAYLDNAPVVLAARSNGPDAFDPERVDAVPLTFRTDGSWIWPSAVAYYLREHDVPPDPELVTHIRTQRYHIPAVDTPARDRALAALTPDLPTD